MDVIGAIKNILICLSNSNEFAVLAELGLNKDHLISSSQGNIVAYKKSGQFSDCLLTLYYTKARGESDRRIVIFEFLPSGRISLNLECFMVSFPDHWRSKSRSGEEFMSARFSMSVVSIFFNESDGGNALMTSFMISSGSAL